MPRWVQWGVLMENNENTQENAPPMEAQPDEGTPDPSVLGRLTPDEQNGMLRIRMESQQLLAKVGEHELLKLRIMARIEELDNQGQEIMASVTKRLGLPPGAPWSATQDGSIRLLQQEAPPPPQGGGSEAS